MVENSASQASDTHLLDGVLAEVKQAFDADRTIMSFREYFSAVLSAPETHLRSSAQYMVDMLHHFGIEHVNNPTGKRIRFKLFDADVVGSLDRRVVGQEAVQMALYRALANFAREGKVNKLIVLHGPNGSAKSSLCRTLMAGLETYAKAPQGAMYSFNWVFPAERIKHAAGIGFGNAPSSVKHADSYAYLTGDDMDARVPCEMHDHPVFLLPQASRQDVLRELLAEPAANALIEPFDRPQTAVSDYLKHGDLCNKCRRIYDALLTSYDGDAAQVLRHVQVERIYLSKRYRRGIATIEPQLSVDARMQQVTADRSLASLPKSMQHVTLFEPTGPLVDANRGMLEYSDLLKRPVEAFKYLLATVETATVAMDSYVLHLDMVYIASTNDTYLDAFKEHPDFSSFKGRMELIKVPYLLRYQSERAIYLPHITGRIIGRHVAPHAVDVAALWAVLTRMRRADPALYPSGVAEVIAALTPLEKLRLYDDGTVPERLTSRQVKELTHSVENIFLESYNYPNYEGRFGASAREIRTALLNAGHHGQTRCLHPSGVFEELRAILQARTVYEFLRQEVVDGYHDHLGFLEQTEDLYYTWVDDEVREAMGLTQDESYASLFSRYVTHVSHWVKKEKLPDASGKLSDPDEGLMGDIERILLGQGESKEDFRRSVIGTIGARALEHPDAKPDYREIFKTYIARLRDDFFMQRRKVVKKMNENFIKFMGTDDGLDAKEKEQAASMLATLKERFDYCDNCARDTVAMLVRKRYAE